MEILEAFDLTGTLRGAAELAGCDHKTVAHWVRAREEAGGGLPVSVRPRPRVDAFAGKIEAHCIDCSHLRDTRGSTGAGRFRRRPGQTLASSSSLSPAETASSRRHLSWRSRCRTSAPSRARDSG